MIGLTLIQTWKDSLEAITVFFISNGLNPPGRRRGWINANNFHVGYVSQHGAELVGLAQYDLQRVATINSIITEPIYRLDTVPCGWYTLRAKGIFPTKGDQRSRDGADEA